MTSDDGDLRRIDEWHNGSISEADFAALQQRLLQDPRLRAEFRAVAVIEEGLTALAWNSILIQPAAQPQVQPKRSLSWLLVSLAIAAAAVLAVMPWRPRSEAPKASVVRSVTALLVDEAGAEFAQKRQPGEVRFDPGSYELLAGTVHLRFANGADLVVQGPARFNIRDESHTQLISGRVRAIVPPTAHGFTIETRDIAYEDIGTEFGLSVDADMGESAMYVFDGQVNLHRAGTTRLLKSVFAGNAVRCRDGRVESAREVSTIHFPSPSEIGHLRWKSLHGEVQTDPNLIAWFPFTREDNASILTNAQRTHGIPDGRIFGAQWAAGRWSGKQALLFDRDSDFAELEIPGEFQELSIGVWLMVDRFDWEKSAILNSNGADPGDLHLQVTRYGLPRGSVLGGRAANYRWVGNPVPLSKWVYVVSVQSIPQRRSVIYVNGERVWEVDIASNDLMIRPGVCRLGNWLAEGAKDGSSPRAMRGRIDEVSVWNRALTQPEIVLLTEKGRPSLLWSRDNPPLRTPMPQPDPPR